eukprot:CAMPEP_0114136554 /NCGR_PEP_ID=MMETSP0043_2-20121206/15295_1 /TAXON_ID=464988 /ORGANISM="Hemiselmis andersenii, Strain CCMP644" /LENGTH=32 /DNA_ID= /DNA_START= /DNA_END= /DNA_ORIENTATION=
MSLCSAGTEEARSDSFTGPMCLAAACPFVPRK